MVRVDVPGYEVLRVLGKGAGTIIYKAVETASQRAVAVKLLVSQRPESAKDLDHLENEYRSLTTIHAHGDGRAAASCIVRARHLIRSGGRWKRDRVRGMVMDYVDGADLRRCRGCPVERLLGFLTQVTDALAFIHECGFAHGDLKPENIMVTPTGHVTLVDFGLSCPLGTRAATIRGTREYMAPEQVDRGVIDARTDLYNLGASFYFLFSGRHVPSVVPPARSSAFAIVSRDLKPAPLQQLNADVPPHVARLIMSCVQHDANLRPGSAAQASGTLKLAAETSCQGRDKAPGR